MLHFPQTIGRFVSSCPVYSARERERWGVTMEEAQRSAAESLSGRDSRLPLDIIAGCSWWNSSCVIMSYTGMTITYGWGNNQPMRAAGKTATSLPRQLFQSQTELKPLPEICTLLFLFTWGTKWITCNSALRGTEVELSRHPSALLRVHSATNSWHRCFFSFSPTRNVRKRRQAFGLNVCLYFSLFFSSHQTTTHSQ